MKGIWLLVIVAAVQAVPWIAEPRPEDSWLRRHEEFKQNTAINRGNISIIFYGDSITERWGTDGKTIFDSKYAPLGAVNYGIGGDQTQHLLYRIADGETDNLTPKLVVLKIGINNLLIGRYTSDETVLGIRAVVNLLLERLPTANLLLLGVLPSYSESFFPRIADINIKISKFHDGNRVYFLNMFNQFASAWGEVEEELYLYEKIHLTIAGYQKWADTMDELFNKLRQ